MPNRTTTDKLALISDELTTQEFNLNALHVEYALDCENAAIDGTEIPKLTIEDKKALKSIRLALKTITAQLHELEIGD